MASEKQHQTHSHQMEKKRLQIILNEMLRVGCVKGFRYFALYLRGREELICRVLNEPMSPEIWSYYASVNSEKIRNRTSSFAFENAANLPRNEQSLIMSANMQQSLSGYGFMDVGLPPASPSDKDIDLKIHVSLVACNPHYQITSSPFMCHRNFKVFLICVPGTHWVKHRYHREKFDADHYWALSEGKDDKSTLFLIAAYARYSCPYVWVRSNHERLVTFCGDSPKEKQKDSPLKLKSTAEWKQRDTKLWDIIAEVVKLCMYPSPLNPLAVDFKYFEGLPLVERVIATGAMAHFLQKVVASGDHAYNARVFDDLGEITRQHFKDLQTLVRQRRSQGIEQEAARKPNQYKEQQPHQYNSHSTQQKQQMGFYQPGPTQQPLPHSLYSGQFQSETIY